MTISAVHSPDRLTTLDVISIGLSVEMFQQFQVWEKLLAHPNGSILPSDAVAYPTDQKERQQATEKRSIGMLAKGIKQFVEHWPIPSVSVWPVYHKQHAVDSDKAHLDFFNDRIDHLRILADLHAHQIDSLGAFFRNEPEEILERAFQFFDGHPEVPALLLFAADGDQTRATTGDISRAVHWGDGPRRFDSLAESMVALLLARRERVDALRPFAGMPGNHLYDDGPAKPGFRPSKYLPQPWTLEQLRQFDRLPTIAVVHRPICISYRKDKEGKPTFDAQAASVMYAQERQSTFKAGFDAALQAIPGEKPARVFYDTGGAVGGHLIPLSLAVNDSLPEFDLFKVDEGYDLSRRIGNTGAASPFVQWALAAMAAFDNKDASIAVSLRQNEEATITVITPSTDVRPAAAVKSATPVPVAATVVNRPPPIRTAALGTRMAHGDSCPQSGLWQCDPPDALAGNTHFIHAGRTLPPARIARNLTVWQKMRGEPAWTIDGKPVALHGHKVSCGATLISTVPNVARG